MGQFRYSSWVMVKPTPSRFNPDLLARDSTQYSVNLPLGQFSRLREILLDDVGDMNATFRFSRRKDAVMVSGRLSTCYKPQCQRCLEPMEHLVDEPFEFVFAKTEQAARDMPDGLDPVVLDDNGQIHVVDLFEDELILHTPTVPKHEQLEQCDVSEHVLSTAELDQHTAQGANENEQESNETGDIGNKRKNPFDVLKNLDLH